MYDSRSSLSFIKITRPGFRLGRLSMLLIALFISTFAAPRCFASWSSFVSSGSAMGAGNPSCASVSNEHVACAAISASSAMMVNEYSGTSWGTWKALTGVIASNPTCTSDGTGKVFCAATAASGALEVAIFSGSAWSTPMEVPGALYSAPSCAEYVAGEVLCAARDSAAGLAWTLYSGGKWSSLVNLSTIVTSAPDCTSDHDSGVICAYLSTGGVTIVNRFAGGGWKGSVNIGGIAGGVPSCTFWKPNGEVACFVKATENGSVYISTFNGGSWTASNWTSYSNLSGTVNDNASCTTQASGELVCGTVSPIGNNEFWANVYNGSSWSNWVPIGGKGLGSPACTPYTTSKVLCLMMGVNNELTSIVGP